MEFGQKKFFMKLIYLISRVFMAWTFLNFLAHYVILYYHSAQAVALYVHGYVKFIYFYDKVSFSTPSRSEFFLCFASNRSCYQLAPSLGRFPNFLTSSFVYKPLFSYHSILALVCSEVLLKLDWVFFIRRSLYICGSSRPICFPRPIPFFR